MFVLFLFFGESVLYVCGIPCLASVRNEGGTLSAIKQHRQSALVQFRDFVECCTAFCIHRFVFLCFVLLLFGLLLTGRSWSTHQHPISFPLFAFMLFVYTHILTFFSCVLSVCLSVCLSACLSVGRAVSRPVCLPTKTTVKKACDNEKI